MTEPRARTELADEALGPWNPGISSHLTPELWRMCTIFRAENTFATWDQVVEFRDLTGLPLSELVVFRPERLVLHEVLVRITADYEVPDPEDADVKSLGVTFRRMTQALLGRLSPRMAWLVAEYAPTRKSVMAIVVRELEAAFDRTQSPHSRSRSPRRGRVTWLRRPTSPRGDAPERDEDRLIAQWGEKARGDDMAAAVYGALIRVVSGIRSAQGRLWGTPELIAPLVTGLACNVHGAALIAARAGPAIADAAAAEGFRALPPQERPVGMSTKGASATGKSTMRPLQRALMARMGIAWGDFALVSPDIFRRDLLDIDSLGPHRRYFGTFTGHELDIVDQKLDRYLAQKVELRTAPHVLVDRFRFDSFAPDSEEERQLQARIRHRRLLHYTFMITSPEQTVERAWQRGLEVGRFKPVDDLLAHNVDAYRGMQSFFLSRALRPGERTQHYEFLDNDVPKGELPLSVAFGWNRELNVVDVRRMVDVDRYCRINVDARHADDVYTDAKSRSVPHNVEFLRTCVRRFPILNLAHRESGRIYACFENGRLAWRDRSAVEAIADPVALEALRVVAPELFAEAGADEAMAARHLDPERFLTLGRWGTALR
jgi:hypothetical protein